MAQIADLIEPLFPYCGAAPDELLITKYRESARAFLTKTRAWRVALVATQGANTGNYVLTVPTGAEAFDFSFARNNESKLTKLTLEQSISRGDPLTGTARGARMGVLSAIVVMPDPGSDISALLTGSVMLRPTLTAAVLETDIADRYAEAIEFGALQRILRVPKEEWTDFEASLYYGALFEAAIEETSVLAADGNMHGVARTVRYGGY